MAGSTFNPRPKSINEVVDYILKRLGVQLLEINVTEEQILDRISDAIVYFQEHHIDGTYEGFFKTKIELSKLVLVESVENKATVGENVIGTGFSAKIEEISEDFKTLYLCDVVGTVVPTNKVTIHTRPEEFTVVSLSVGPLDNGGWIEIPTNVEAIVEILQVPTELDPTATINSSGSAANLNTMYSSQFFDYRGGKLGTSFYLQQVRQETMNWLTTLNPWVDFNRYTNKVYLNAYDYVNNVGNWVVFKVIVAVDPEEFPEMYGDTWFLQYCVEKVRLQWGENLSKFDEVALLNGVKVNGAKITDMAERRLDKLEEEMHSRYRKPDEMFLA